MDDNDILEKYASQLKTCPFCGGKVRLFDNFYGSSNYGSGSNIAIECRHCKLQMNGKDTSWQHLADCEPQLIDIVAKWNKRV